MPSDTSARTRAIRVSQERANAAALLVDTILVTPTGIDLTIGSPLELFRTVQVEARDSAGRTVSGFAPVFSVADNSIASLRSGQITGLREGTTALRVEAMVFNDATLPPRPRQRTNVPLRVRSATGSVAPNVSAPGTTVPPREGRMAYVVRPREDSIPRELVQALLGPGAQLVVGGTTEVFPQSLFRDARVIGSRIQGPSVTTVITLPYARATAFDSLRVRLTAAGWSAPAPPPATRGFVATLSPFGLANVLCRESEAISFGSTVQDSQHTTVVLSHARTQGRSQCDAGFYMARASAPDDIPLPPLHPPPNVRIGTRGSGGSSDDWHSEARIEEAMPVAEVLQHYLAQMQTAKWVLGDRSVVGGIALATFTFSDLRARRWQAVLSVISPPGVGYTDLRISVRTY